MTPAIHLICMLLAFHTLPSIHYHPPAPFNRIHPHHSPIISPHRVISAWGWLLHCSTVRIQRIAKFRTRLTQSVWGYANTMFWVLQIPTSWTGGVSVVPLKFRDIKRESWAITNTCSHNLFHFFFTYEAQSLFYSQTSDPLSSCSPLQVPRRSTAFSRESGCCFSFRVLLHNFPTMNIALRTLFHFFTITWTVNPKIIISNSSIPKCAYTSTTVPWG